MSNFSKLVFLAIITIFFHIEIDAQSSPRVSIQGTLKDANGAAAADGTYSVTFRLYHTATGGAVIWSEEASVDVAGGIYSHYLGSVVPLNSSNFSSTLFLGVKVGAYELSPRTELTYAPYAFAVLESVCSGALGDIKYSMLNPTQFAAVNGSCWVPMDGRSISGSALNNLSGINNVPDGGGLFLRAQEFSGGANNDPDRNSNSPIATVQDQAFLSHSHPLSDPGHGHAFSDKVRKLGGTTYNISGSYGIINQDSNNLYDTVSNSTGGALTGISLSPSGGSETRPKNMNFWIYIRIN